MEKALIGLVMILAVASVSLIAGLIASLIDECRNAHYISKKKPYKYELMIDGLLILIQITIVFMALQLLGYITSELLIRGGFV